MYLQITPFLKKKTRNLKKIKLQEIVDRCDDKLYTIVQLRAFAILKNLLGYMKNELTYIFQNML